jgi:hypothetical protein
MTYVDLYCERIATGLWGEPANAVTNAAFVLSAVVLWRFAQHTGKLNSRLRLVLCLMGAIGIGSGLFHTFATAFTRVLDELPIALFVLYYVWLYCRLILRIGAVPTSTLLVATLLAAYAGKQFPQLFNGSLMYAPVLLLAFCLGLNHLSQDRRERYGIIAAGAAFVAALVFRTVDNAICPVFPLGTHFLWHLLDATALYLVTRTLISNMPRGSLSGDMRTS